jgi:PAS domain S-box-containing protein
MKPYVRVLGITAVAIVIFWLTDALIDSMFHSDETFIESLLFNDKEHAFRFIVSVCFLIFAIFLTRIIYKQRITENALRESEEKYRMLFNSVSDAVLVHDITEDGMPGKFTASNDIACNLYGYSKEELAELTPGDLNDPDRAADPVPIVDKLLKEKHVLFETVDRKKDGGNISVEISSHLFEFKGEPIIISAIRDITERKNVENKLKENQNYIEAIIEATPT